MSATLPNKLYQVGEPDELFVNVSPAGARQWLTSSQAGIVCGVHATSLSPFSATLC